MLHALYGLNHLRIVARLPPIIKYLITMLGYAYLENINSHMPTADENELVFVERTGHTYQMKEQEVADILLETATRWKVGDMVVDRRIIHSETIYGDATKRSQGTSSQAPSRTTETASRRSAPETADTRHW